MKKLPADCQAARGVLLDLALTGVGQRALPHQVEEHLRRCDRCTKYYEGLRTAPELFPTTTLYTPGLRRRTLAAIDERRGRPAWLTPLLFPASAASVMASIIAPVWLLGVLLQPLLNSPWQAFGLAFVICSSTGLAAFGAGLAVWNQLREVHHG